MKKWVIGSLVGAIIVFAWQAASWMFLGIHNDAHKYHPAQDSIMNVLSASLTEDACYSFPAPKPGASETEKKELMKQMEGKPWASVIYHKSYSFKMAKTMTWGFIVDLALVVLLISIMVRGGLPSFKGIVTGCIAVGLFSFLWSQYMGHIWFALPGV